MIHFILILFCFLPTFVAFEPIRSRNNERQNKQPNERRTRPSSQSRESNRYRDREYNDDDLHQEEEHDNIIPFSMEHSFGNSGWSKRGDLEFMFNSVTKRVGKAKFMDVEITPDHIKELHRITSEDKYYRVRLVPRDYDGNNVTKYVIASVKACALMASDFREMFTFHSDIYGTIISLDYKTTHKNCPNTSPKAVTEKYFRSKGKITVANLGKSPFITKESFFSKGAQGSKPAEKSFFQKYWVYILAAGVTWAIIAAVGGEGGNAGGGGGGGTAG